MYEPGKNTVLLNESGSALNLGLKYADGALVTLHPRKGRNFVDVEAECDPKSLQSFISRFADWTSQGLVSWHPTGSNPSWVIGGTKFQLPAEGETRTAPSNEYDVAINVLNAKQKKEDEKTKQQSTGQDRRVDAPRTVTLTPADNQTRTADIGKGEIDAATLDRDAPPADPFENWESENLLEYAVKFDVITKKGNHFKFEGDSLGNGFKKAASRLKTDANLLERVKVRLPSPS